MQTIIQKWNEMKQNGTEAQQIVTEKTNKELVKRQKSDQYSVGLLTKHENLLIIQYFTSYGNIRLKIQGINGNNRKLLCLFVFESYVLIYDYRRLQTTVKVKPKFNCHKGDNFPFSLYLTSFTRHICHSLNTECVQSHHCFINKQ